MSLEWEAIKVNLSLHDNMVIDVYSHWDLTNSWPLVHVSFCVYLQCSQSHSLPVPFLWGKRTSILPRLLQSLGDRSGYNCHCSRNTGCLTLYDKCLHNTRLVCIHIHVEPPNKGQFGSATFVLYSEAVLWFRLEVQIITDSTIIISISAIASVLYTEVVLWWEGPL